MFLHVILVFLSIAFVLQWRKRFKLPPGPAPFLFIGNVPQFAYHCIRTGSIVETLRHFKEVYGPIFTIWLGPLPTVHIGTIDLAHDVMIKDGTAFSDRWVPYLMNYHRDSHGVITSNGDLWVEQRRFCLQTLRNFGVGRNIIEERIMHEFDERTMKISQRLQNNNAAVISANQFFDLLVGNILNRMLLSFRFDKRSEIEFFALKTSMDKALQSFGLADLYINEWTMSLPFLKQRCLRLLKPIDDILDYLKKNINDRKSAIAKGDHIITGEGTDFVDAYLKKMNDEKSVPDSGFNDFNLQMCLLDLWTAGQETTTITLTWGLCYFLNFPEIVRKVRDEIKALTNLERPLSLTDRSETPYFNATIMEIQRHASILNVNLWRKTREPTKLGDYIIDQNVPISAQLSLIMSDEKIFNDHRKFDPERYLKDATQSHSVIPFGIGKRVCPGESLARSELYLILGNLLSKYEIAPVGELPPLVDCYPTTIFKRTPKYEVKLSPIV